ncbi:FkbM family methyltransferase [Candidatus Symbiobacter mobilis]|uniref:SAM-dependent methyltransferase n=1 Tax=Candidatus Symbiobacter mobilis CR TaxID=946483 RepID=U5NAE7_9BURK|nr:FkbM family methyltransferase [Candidatus Symbiobacter mobilis]AGX88347.1 SAM-dependent methyltransferase [Candidatus Symbiobacter mobilis CR]
MQENIEHYLAELIERVSHLETTVREIRNLVGPFGTMFPDGTMLVQTIHGTKYFIDPTDEIMAPQLVVYRQWEPDLSTFMVNSTTPDTIFLDVGANFGYFTCLVGSRIGSQGNGCVIAAEPNPLMQRLLQKNTKINWSMAPIELHNCAVTEQEGFAEFAIPHDRAANASLVSSTTQNSDERLIVRSVTLDQLAAGRKVDLIKIDVEGFETAVLRGSSETIMRSPNIIIIIEWSLQQMREAGFTACNMIELLKQYKLHAFHLPSTRFITEDQWAKLEISFEQLQHVAYNNILLQRRP